MFMGLSARLCGVSRVLFAGRRVGDVTVHGTDKYPILMARDGVATTLATEDNVDRRVMDLEQSQMKVT